jgi:hypothetical protein
MTHVLTNVSTLSAIVSCSALVVPTTLVQVPQHHVFDFADYLDEQDLSDVIANGDVLRSATTGNVFLDILPIAEVAPNVVSWLKEHRCPRFSGCCRVALAPYALMADLLAEYPGNSWEAQGYTAIAASALEVSVALELRGCSTLLQLELSDASPQLGSSLL